MGVRALSAGIARELYSPTVRNALTLIRELSGHLSLPEEELFKRLLAQPIPPPGALLQATATRAEWRYRLNALRAKQLVQCTGDGQVSLTALGRAAEEASRSLGVLRRGHEVSVVDIEVLLTLLCWSPRGPTQLVDLARKLGHPLGVLYNSTSPLSAAGLIATIAVPGPQSISAGRRPKAAVLKPRGVRVARNVLRLGGLRQILHKYPPVTFLETRALDPASPPRSDQVTSVIHQSVHELRTRRGLSGSTDVPLRLSRYPWMVHQLVQRELEDLAHLGNSRSRYQIEQDHVFTMKDAHRVIETDAADVLYLNLNEIDGPDGDEVRRRFLLLGILGGATGYDVLQFSDRPKTAGYVAGTSGEQAVLRQEAATAGILEADVVQFGNHQEEFKVLMQEPQEADIAVFKPPLGAIVGLQRETIRANFVPVEIGVFVSRDVFHSAPGAVNGLRADLSAATENLARSRAYYSAVADYLTRLSASHFTFHGIPVLNEIAQALVEPVSN